MGLSEENAVYLLESIIFSIHCRKVVFYVLICSKNLNIAVECIYIFFLHASLKSNVCDDWLLLFFFECVFFLNCCKVLAQLFIPYICYISIPISLCFF